MVGNNLASVTLTEEQKTAIRGALDALDSQVKPLLISLSPDQKKEIAKASIRMTPFINRVVGFTDTNGEFVPRYMDVAELKVDVIAVNTLTEFRDRLRQILGLLDDTIMLSGSEAYMAALHYYNAVKQSAKAKVPAAQVIYDELKVYFAKTPRK